ncbi:hypothetical protein [Mycolicibacterium vinylchloridicum]|uniref:hypothetical protein n=1 Tax=Mycolicibacterium vinylchloridicum TaxID=2736928 RepID=UPI001F405A4A|nr:hypothetical protein [Mycolicibacterium vinylchloridicum]
MAAAGTEIEFSVVGETAAALDGADDRFVCSWMTGAEKSVRVLAVRAGLGLPAVLVEVRADRADDAELLDTEEAPLDAWPESSGAAAATAAPAPEAISKPLPITNPNVAIRPARLMEVTSAPAHITANEFIGADNSGNPGRPSWVSRLPPTPTTRR